MRSLSSLRERLRSLGARIDATRWRRSENHDGPSVASILRDASLARLSPGWGL